MPNEVMPDPFVNCCFITDDKIFVAVYYAPKKMHYHFIWDETKKAMTEN
jgi:hypothetical protein